jgi:hypothetical protein
MDNVIETLQAPSTQLIFPEQGALTARRIDDLSLVAFADGQGARCRLKKVFAVFWQWRIYF